MGYGQYTEGTRHDYPQTPVVGKRDRDSLERSAKCEHTAIDGTKLAPIDRVVSWGHNRIKVIRENGVQEWRLHDTAILINFPNGDFIINTGGWRTPTTRTAIMQAFDLIGLSLSYWHDKKRGGCVLNSGTTFKSWCRFRLDGGAIKVIAKD